MSERSSLLKKDGKFTAFFKNNKYVFVSALAAFLISQLVAFCYDLIPYGDMTILRMDLYHQYGPLFAELYDRLTSGESLVYSWNSGLGSTFLGNYFNYLSSPLTLIVLFFGHKNITEAISVLIMLKAILSAATFTYYLKSSFNKHSASTAAFGVLYAFCGYFVAYYWNLMWLDAMVLFPLIILGIERIIKKGKPSLYCICLAVMIFANYYMAFMVCIFSVLYFFAYYFANYPASKKFNDEHEKESLIGKIKNSVFLSSGIKFAIFSVAAALLAAVAILPLMTILSSSSATSGTAPTAFVKYFDAFDFLANHLAGTEPTIRSSGDDVLPNVYCGVLTLVLVPLYLFSKKISIREKISYCSLLAALYLSFNVNYLNYFWHGLHFPNDLPYRFSFMYSFVLLIMAFKAFSHIKEFTGREILGSGIAVTALLVLVEKITSKNVTDVSLIISLVFVIGYVSILYLFKSKKFVASAVSVLLLCSVCSEIALSNTDHYSMNQSKTNYTVDYDSFQEMKTKLDEFDGGFYRMELMDLRTRMDPCWFDYNGVSTFSSMAYESVANLQQDVGMYGNYINSYTYYSQTPVYNAMFGLKYLFNNTTDDVNTQLLTEMFANGDFDVYKNNFDLSVAFAANNEISSWDSSAYSDPFVAQSELFRMATGVDNVFTKLNVEDASYSNINTIFPAELESGNMKVSKITNDTTGSICLEITPQVEQNVYIYVDSSSVESVSASSLMFTKSLDTLDEGYIVDLGLRPAGETIYVDMSVSKTADTGNITFYAYGLNLQNFAQGYMMLKSGNYNITEYTDTYLNGTISADSDKTVFTSIPYDINWHVYIDGKQLSSDEVFKISNGLLAFSIPQGEHTVTLNYVSSGLIAGEFVSILTILVMTIFIIMKRRKILFFKKERPDRWAALNNDDFLVEVENIFPSQNDDVFAIDENAAEEKVEDNLQISEDLIDTSKSENNESE